MSAHSASVPRVTLRPPAAQSPQRPTRAAALPPDERRQAIVDTVIPLLVERGASVTTREIAEAAGVAEGTLFRVFDDKAALLHAAAHAMLDPERRRRTLAEIDPELTLDAMVRTVAEQLLESMGQVVPVLMALRGTVGSSKHERPGRHGPPEFILESHRALLEGLTELFGRYRAQLSVEPARAALMMRALVLGSRQPWTEEALSLTGEEIATVLITGVAAGAPSGKP